MDTTINIALAALSTACFGSLILFIVLIHRNTSSLHFFGEHYPMRRPIHQILFLCATSIAFIVCMFQGATTLMYWAPDSWLGIDKPMIAALFALVGGVALFWYILEASGKRYEARLRTEEVDFLEKIIEAKTAENLEVLRGTLLEQLAEVRRRIPINEILDSAKRVDRAVDQKISSYYRLLAAVNIRIDDLKMRMSTDEERKKLETAQKDTDDRLLRERDAEVRLAGLLKWVCTTYDRELETQIRKALSEATIAAARGDDCPFYNQLIRVEPLVQAHRSGGWS